MSAGARRALVGLLAVWLLPACEIQKVVVAQPEDVLVAEVYLRADAVVQTAFLHRTIQDQASVDVPGARVVVTGPAGDTVHYAAAEMGVCVDAEPGSGSCYAAGDSLHPFHVRAGAQYRLSIVLADGRTLEGETVVPQDFRMLRPASSPCGLPVDSLLHVAWTPSDGAWVYVTGAEIRGLQAAFAPLGVAVDDPFVLTGLSISREDTTIVFPSEFGVFDRFDLPRALVLALQEGLPDGVSAHITIGAADQNYVNWSRRGTFNPSGLVRVSSLRGDGIGVFGSLVTKSVDVQVGREDLTACR
ncbi:MAG: hypothetical protein P8Z36_04735 [Gemmatimonadota bacterium]